MKFTKFYEEAVIPTRGTKFSAGYDLVASDSVTIQPGFRRLVPTGIGWSVENDDDLNNVGFIWPRSGLASKAGLDTMAGVIDADYGGEIKVLLINLSDVPYVVNKGDKVAQLVIQKFTTVSEDTHNAVVRNGGFGSTGK